MLTDDIRKAIDGLVQALPDAVLTMVWGKYTGKAIRSSSNDIGSDSVTADGPTEKRRVIVRGDAFPGITSGCFVRVGSSSFIVTSASEDPIGASTKIGLSEEMRGVSVRYSGIHRVDGKTRTIDLGIEALAVKGGMQDAISNQVAPMFAEEWFVAFAVDSWGEVGSPEIGDSVEFYTDHLNKLKVADVAAKDGHWVLTCRRRA